MNVFHVHNLEVFRGKKQYKSHILYIIFAWLPTVKFDKAQNSFKDLHIV